MESIVKKSLSSLLIIMMLFAIAMPAIVNAAEEPLYKMEDMKLNTIVYFKGQMYSSIHYACNNAKYAKEIAEEGTAGIVWKLNKKYDSIVVQLSNGAFRTVPVAQVTAIRAEKYVNLNVGTLDDLKNGNLKLNITIDGERNDLVLDNGVNITGSLENTTIGFEKGFSKLTITKDGKTITDMFIIKDAHGNISLDVDERKVSGEVAAVIVESFKTGAEVSLEVNENNEIVLAAGAEVKDKNGEHTYVGAKGELSYDFDDPNADIMAQGEATLLDKSYASKKVDTQIIKTIMKLIDMIKALK